MYCRLSLLARSWERGPAVIRRVAYAGLAAMAIAFASARAAEPIRVMILDGESAGAYHKWQLVTPVLRKQLDETGLFTVDVVTVPPAASDFRAPAFGDYRVVVFNYDAPDERWPAAVKLTFEQYVRSGGGLVVVHAADNAFPGWRAFNEMIGVGGWRGRAEAAGPFWYVKDGRVVSDNTPGAAGSHGNRVPVRRHRPRTGASDHRGPAENLDAPGRRVVREAARAGAEHDRAGHGVFRSVEQRLRTRRASADGAAATATGASSTPRSATISTP